MWAQRSLVFGEFAALFSVPDHVGADPALHAVGGIAAFDLRQNGGFTVFGDVIQFHQRVLPNGEAVVVVNARHNASVWGLALRRQLSDLAPKNPSC